MYNCTNHNWYSLFKACPDCQVYTTSTQATNGSLNLAIVTLESQKLLKTREAIRNILMEYSKINRVRLHKQLKDILKDLE